MIIFISNFRHVVNVVSFLLFDSPASEFYVPTLHSVVDLFKLESMNTIDTYS